MGTESLAVQTSQASQWLDVFCCPVSREPLTVVPGGFSSPSGRFYRVGEDGIPLFAEELCSEEGRVQQAHYDRIASAYVTNLTYPHTQEYMAYLDDALFNVVEREPLGLVAEICCGHGEAFHLLRRRVQRGMGIDISVSMLRSARESCSEPEIGFAQGDATMLPLQNNSVDNIFMLGGIHHVNDRFALFSELFRILKPGGRFYFREPVSDFWLWRFLRAIVYRLAPALDAETERPLRFKETEPVLKAAGFDLKSWSTQGFLGFCIFMNSDVLVVNRLLRFVPGIRTITRLATQLDQWILSLPGLSKKGLQVVGVAQKPQERLL